MASVRKFTDPRPRRDGKRRVAWRVRWTDADGRRRVRDWPTRAEAERFRARVDSGAARRKLTLADVADLLLEDKRELARAGELAASTAEQYRQHIQIHFLPDPIARLMAGEAEAVDVQEYFERLRAGGVSLALARKIQTTTRLVFKRAILAGCRRDNPAAIARVPGKKAERRRGKPARVPPRDQCAALLAAADARADKDGGRAAALVRVFMLAGLRSGEARALRRNAINAARAPYWIDVRASADKWGDIRERPKTDHGRRRVYIGEETARILRAWLGRAPVSAEHLVFPDQAGGVWRQESIRRNTWIPVCRAAGLARLDEKRGEWQPLVRIHDARHVAASAKIAIGWRGEKLKNFMGHHSVEFTLDVYGHLFPSDDPDGDAREANAGERFFDMP